MSEGKQKKACCESLQYEALKLSSKRHRIPGCISNRSQGRLCNPAIFCHSGVIHRAFTNSKGAGPNSKGAFALTKRILVQSNTFYAKAEGSWKCIQLQELEISDEQISARCDGNSRTKCELGKHDQIAAFLDILYD